MPEFGEYRLVEFMSGNPTRLQSGDKIFLEKRTSHLCIHRRNKPVNFFMREAGRAIHRTDFQLTVASDFQKTCELLACIAGLGIEWRLDDDLPQWAAAGAIFRKAD